MKKKLLIFHQALAPYRVDFFNHFAERFDMDLVLFDTNLVNQKFDQTKLLGKMKCRVSYLLGGFKWKDRYFRTGAIRRIWQEKPDVVFGCEYSLATIAIAVYRFVFRSKFRFYTITDDNVAQFSARRGLKSGLRWLFVRLLDGFVVTNDETKAAYEAITPKSCGTRYFVVPILHDEKEMRKNPVTVIECGRRWRDVLVGGNSAAKVVLFVGRLDEVKNVMWLVEQFNSSAIKSDGEIFLVLVGAGPQEAELRKYVQANGLENVVMLGRKEGDELYGIMSAVDALVLPSGFEPYGAVVGEALQWGTPCLVSDRVGAKGLVADGSRGEVFRFGDADDFASKLQKVVNMKKSSEPLIGDELGIAVEALADDMVVSD